MNNEEGRKRFVKIMAISLVSSLVVGICINLGRDHIPEEIWNVINWLLFQDITAEGGKSAIGLFYIVQTLFTNALKLAIVPLVFFSMILSVCSMNDMRKLGRIAIKTVLIFLCFYVIACTFGWIASEAAIKGGLYSPFNVAGATAEVQEVSAANVLSTIVYAVPDNMISALGSNNKMISVVTIAIIIGVCIATMEEKTRVLKQFCEACSAVVQKFLDFVVVKCCPIAIFCMVVRTFAVYHAEDIGNILVYMVLTIAVMLLYLFTIYPLAIAVFLRCNPVTFMKKIFKVGVVAFGTASSAPCLPLNREACVEELGCSEAVADFVLPVGMTINMNGTAIMHIIGAAFIATSAGFHVTPGHYLTMMLLAIASSMGAPGIASAGTVMLYAVLTGAGFNTELCAIIYTMVFALHKPCGMVQTVLNVVGDATTALLVAKSENEFDKDLFNC